MAALLVAAACSGTTPSDQAPADQALAPAESTTTTSTVANVETPVSPASVTTTSTHPATWEAYVVELDATIPEEVWWAQPSLVLGPNGEPRVLYQSGETSASLAVCADAECSEVTHTEVLDTGTWLGWLWATPLPHGGAYIHAQGGFGADMQRRIVCVDDQCVDPVVRSAGTAELGNPMGAAVALDALGEPLEVSVHAGPPNRAISVRCQDAACEDTSNWITATFPNDVWLGDAAVAFDDMTPVLAFRTDRGIVLARCDLAVPGAPNCSPDSVRILTEMSIPNIVRAPQLIIRDDGSPSLVLFVDMSQDPEQFGPEAIMVASCTDLECGEHSLTKIAVMTDMWAEPELVAAAGPDGNLWMAYSQDGRLHLTRCIDAMCEEYVDSDTGFACTDVALVFAADGQPIVVTHSVERGLELVLCGDAECVIEG